MQSDYLTSHKFESVSNKLYESQVFQRSEILLAMVNTIEESMESLTIHLKFPQCRTPTHFYKSFFRAYSRR